VIRGREQEERIGHRVAPRREHAGRAQRHVGADRKNDDQDDARQQGTEAPENAAVDTAGGSV
jgi:hypothetical protein